MKYLKVLAGWALPMLTLLVSGMILQRTAGAAITVCASGCGYTDIQGAVSAAIDGETIQIGQGLFAEKVNITNKNLILVGEGAHLTAIDGRVIDDGKRVIDMQCDSNYTISITGVTITGGFPFKGFGGGGIQNSGCELILTNSLVTNNVARAAAGIGNGGSLILENSIIANNGAFDLSGGGISNSGKLEIAGSTIISNTARNGGGGITNSGQLFVRNSTIANNEARLGGGIAVATGGNATVEACIISNNEARQKGGGIFNVATLTLEGSVVLSNTAVSPDMTSTDDYGGGIYNSGGMILNQIIVTKNSADDGGGLFDEGTVTATGATITNNNPNNCGGSGFMCP